MIKQDICKKIYQNRPSVILTIDNEYMAFLMGEQIKQYYGNSAVPCPQRHYYNRFVRDMRMWTEKYIDHMHYTVPLKTAVAGDYEFPG